MSSQEERLRQEKIIRRQEIEEINRQVLEDLKEGKLRQIKHRGITSDGDTESSDC